MMPRYDMIVIGASAGGVEAVKRLISLLPKDLPVPVFVVLHLSPYGKSYIASILARAGHLPATFAQDHETIEPGHIYIAPPNRHMMLVDGIVRLNEGPKENRTRPAINPLFRSAARWYGAGTIGVVLTGLLDDGTAGLAAIKAQGGLAIVQDPDEAQAPSMPLSAMKYVAVDHILPLSEIADLLVQLTNPDQISTVPPKQGE